MQREWAGMAAWYWEEGLSQGLCLVRPPGGRDLAVLSAHLPGRAGNRCAELSSELGTAPILMGFLRAEPCSRAAVFSSWLS